MVIAERENVLAPDLEKHRGHWVAIKGGQIVAVGKHAADVVRQLEERKISGAALHRVAEASHAAFVL